MQRTLVFAESDFEQLRHHLLASEDTENAAFLVCGVSQTPKQIILLVREVVPVTPEGFQTQESLRLTIAPEFTNRVLKRCRSERRSVVLCHSHPFAEGGISYSKVDNEGELLLFRNFYERIPDLPHASLLFGKDVVTGRFWGYDGTMFPVDRIDVIGRAIEFIAPYGSRGRSGPGPNAPMYDRQVRTFGEAGQALLRSLRVAIVGAGGTGSAVFEQLVRLGVGEILVVDDDLVEDSNLSRIIGSTRGDIARPKVEVLANWAAKVNPHVTVIAVKDTIFNEDAALLLREADAVFCCTDNHWSRAILNQLSYQYLKPVIDMGIQLVVEDGALVHGAGKVVRLGPGFPCLWCYGDISPEMVAEENLPPEERAKLAQEGYVRGMNIPNPSVITFNLSVASAAVTEFLKMVTGLADENLVAGRLNFDLLSGVVRRATAIQRVDCICDPSHVKALGDLERLPTRPSSPAG